MTRPPIKEGDWIMSPDGTNAYRASSMDVRRWNGGEFYAGYKVVDVTERPAPPEPLRKAHYAVFIKDGCGLRYFTKFNSAPEARYHVPNAACIIRVEAVEGQFDE